MNISAKTSLALFPLILICTLGFAREEYPFEPNLIDLQGVLTSESRYGPPNFGDSPEIDQEVTIYVLKLESPIAVGTETSLSEVNDSVVADVSVVQVVPSTASVGLGRFVGKSVCLSGTLSKQIASHDFYPVILRVVRAVPLEP